MVNLKRVSRLQTREHAGHAHHHHNNTYLTSANKNDAGVRITRIGLWVNLGMAVGKGVGGYAFNSQALSADAVHSLTDLVSDFMTLATVSLALKKPSERFPLGYGKIESLGSLGVSGLLLTGGLLMGWGSIIELSHVYFPTFAELLEQLHLSHAHSHSHAIPGIGAAWLAGGSVIVKEWLYRATMKVAKEKKSSVLESNAVHHRVDSLTGVAALLSISASNIFPTLSGMDALGGLIISWLVIRAGWTNTRTALVELADASIDEETKSKARRAASQALSSTKIKGDLQVVSVQGTKAGQNYLLELDVSVPATATAGSLQELESRLRDAIGAKVRGAKRVRVRFVSNDSQPELLDEFISPSVSARSTPEPEEHDHHHHDHDHSHSHEQEHTVINNTHTHPAQDQGLTKQK